MLAPKFEKMDIKNFPEILIFDGEYTEKINASFQILPQKGSKIIIDKGKILYTNVSIINKVFKNEMDINSEIKNTNIVLEKNIETNLWNLYISNKQISEKIFKIENIHVGNFKGISENLIIEMEDNNLYVEKVNNTKKQTKGVKNNLLKLIGLN